MAKHRHTADPQFGNERFDKVRIIFNALSAVSGRFAVARKVDALSLNPLDERIGGLHLQEGGLVLRRERGGKLVGA